MLVPLTDCTNRFACSEEEIVNLLQVLSQPMPEDYPLPLIGCSLSLLDDMQRLLVGNSALIRPFVKKLIVGFLSPLSDSLKVFLGYWSDN
jgi:hypothetical protein